MDGSVCGPAGLFHRPRRHVAPNVFASQDGRVRIALVALALTRTEGLAVGVRCMLVLGATAVSEAVSALCMLAFYRRDARSAFRARRIRPADPARRLWEVLCPWGGPCKRPAHGGEYAGARLPFRLSDQRGRAHRPPWPSTEN